ncbi:Ig-like domain-containing protein [Patescibacteria group bacterium]|nr:Ig-like domain-containing protein [Patescibacteria group bacterium]
MSHKNLFFKTLISVVMLSTVLSMTGIPYIMPVKFASAAAPAITAVSGAQGRIFVTFDQNIMDATMNSYATGGSWWGLTASSYVTYNDASCTAGPTGEGSGTSCLVAQWLAPVPMAGGTSTPQNQLEIGLGAVGGGWGSPSTSDTFSMASGLIANVSSEGMSAVSNQAVSAVDTTPPDPVTGVVLADNDSNSGIDGRDFSISFTASADAGFSQYSIFIVPSYITFDPWMYVPIMESNLTFSGTGFTGLTDVGSGTLTVTGKSTMTQDSTNSSFSSQNYTAYIMIEDTSMNRSMVASSGTAPIVSDVTASANQIIISEVNWAGSTASTTDEWIELQNATTTPINISGWVIENAGDSAALTLNTATCGASANFSIPAGGYYLISKYALGSSNSRLNIGADCIAPTISLHDTGATNGNLILKTSASGTTVYTLDLSLGWPAGDATNKYSMEWVGSAWSNAGAAINLDAGVTDKGTPKAPNGSDAAAPTMTAAYGTAGTNSFRIVFSEPVEMTTAQTASNYTLNNSLTVGSVNVDFANDPSGSTVRVYLASGQALPSIQVTATVSNVTDMAANPISASSEVNFTPTANSTSDATPPQMEHMPIGWGWQNNDISFFARATDTSGISYTRLLFRESGTTAYTEVNMDSLGNSMYMYTLNSDDNPSGTNLNNKDIEYYIKSEDTVGNIQTVPADMKYGTGLPYIIARAGNTASGVTVSGANGAVTDGTNNIEGAYVIFPGFGAPAVQTNSNGAFTMNNVPMGWFDFVFFASGFMPQMMNGINTNSNYTFAAGSVSFNSSTGDTSQPPTILYTGPADGGTNVPSDLYNVMIAFSEPMKASTIITSNIYMKNSSNNSVTATVSYDSYTNQAYLTPSSFLQPSTTYTVYVTTSVQDSSGTPLSTTFNATFTTGAMYSADAGGGYYVNNTCPFIEGTMPQMGATAFPTNGTLTLMFSDAMATSTLTASNIKFYPAALGVGFAASWASSTYNATYNTFAITFSGLTASTEYELRVYNSNVLNTNGYAVGCGGGDFFGKYTTSGGADATPPQVNGQWPNSGATGVLLSTGDINVGFSEGINPSTITTTNLSLSPSVSGTTVSYEQESKMAHIIPGGLLTAGTTYTVTVSANVTDLAGNALDGNKNGTGGDAYSFTFATEASNSDTTPPEVMFANADNFSLAVSFTEPMNNASSTATASVTNPSNYSLWSPWDSANNTGTQINLSGKTITWDPMNNTANISGLSLNPAATFKIKASNVKDMSGQAISTGMNSATGTVLDNASTFGQLGPGQMMGEMDFGMKGMGMMAGAWPMNAMAGVTTNYFIDVPIQVQIPDAGKIILTFPQGFDVTNAAAMATTTSYANQDINGPGAGTITISSVTANQTSRTITVIISGATNGTPDPYMGFMDFLHFDLQGIINSSVPKDFETNGYTVDIKTKNSSNVILETMATAPIYISSPGTNVIRGIVSSGGTGLNGVTVYLGSPMTGPQEATTASQDCGSGAVSGCFIFSNLPDGNFDLWLQSSFTVSSTEYRGVSRPEMIWLNSGNSPFTKSFSVTSAANMLKIAGTITGPADEKVMVWTNRSQSGQWMEKEYTLTSGSADYSIAVDAAGEWEVGVNPWHPTGPMTMGPPPEPNFMPPQPKRVGVADAGGGNTTLTDYSTTANATSTISSAGAVSAGAGIDFALSGADQRIKGYVVDASNNPIPNAEVWAYNPGGMGMGAHTQSTNDGTFTLKVGTGMFKVGASAPGLPMAPEKAVEVFTNGSKTGGSADGNTYADVIYASALVVDTTGVRATAANPFVIKIQKSSYTISGKVVDSANNVITGASVWAFKQNDPGNARTVTGSDGSYTLYVASLGTWTVEADAPGYGYLGSRSVVLSATNSTPSGENFTPSSTIAEITGTVSGVSDVSGVNIWADKTDHTYFNNSFTDSSGNFTIRLEYSSSTSTQYNIGAWSPEIGDFGKNAVALNTSGAVSSGTTTFAVAGLNTITVNAQDSNGTAFTVEEMFVDFYDSTNFFGRNADIKNGNSGTISLPDGTYEVHAWVPGFGSDELTITGAGIATSTGIAVLTVDGAETVNVKQAATSASMYAVSGTVTSGGSAAGNAFVWMDKLSGAGGSHTGVHRNAGTSSTGTYSLSVTEGYYLMGVDKPGYDGPNPAEVHITANSTGNNFTLTQNTLNISGRVWADANSNNTYDTGEGIENAWVWGDKLGGGWSGVSTDPDGSYSLNVSSGQWTIRAESERYQTVDYASNPVDSAASPTGINIQLSQTRTVAQQRSKPITPANGGTFDDKSNSGVKIVLPPNALGSDTNSGQVSVQNKNSVPTTATRKPFAGKGKEINATDNSGRAVNNLNSSITIEIDVTKSEIDTSVAAGEHTYADVANVTNGYWDSTKNNWVDITTTKSVSADGSSVEFSTFASLIAANPSTYTDYTITLKSTTDHLSDFAPLVPTDASAPATPTGLAATASTSGTATVTLTWSANSEGDLSGYYIYRSINGGTTYPLLADAGNVLTYADSSSLTSGTTYYYKISAYDTGSNESAATAAVSGTPTVPATEEVGGTILPTGGGGGGDSGAQEEVITTIEEPAAGEITAPEIPLSQMTATQLRAKIAELLQTILKLQAALLELKGETGGVITGVPSFFSFTSNLKQGMSSTDVKYLQIVLNSSSDTMVATTGVGSSGHETNYFGSLTKAAVVKFQNKYASEVLTPLGLSQATGYVGSSTRTKLNALLGK